jgi:sterol desaturase/sphingolipid hydroxylase (fatty acid hydroxylase superfamily)
MSIFVHANLRLPEQVDRPMRLGLVTPDLHRTHHSADPREQVGNFAVVSPVWDRLFGTYLAEPRGGHEALRFGLDGFDDLRHQKLPSMLLNPFLRRSHQAVVPSTAGPAE